MIVLWAREAGSAAKLGDFRREIKPGSVQSCRFFGKVNPNNKPKPYRSAVQGHGQRTWRWGFGGAVVTWRMKNVTTPYYYLQLTHFHHDHDPARGVRTSAKLPGRRTKPKHLKERSTNSRAFA